MNEDMELCLINKGYSYNKDGVMLDQQGNYEEIKNRLYDIFLVLQHNTNEINAKISAERRAKKEQEKKDQQLSAALANEEKYKNADNAHPYGPKIFGLQLGMDASTAKNIIENMCNKYNIKCEEKIDKSLYLLMTDYKDVICYGNGSQLEIAYKNNILLGYTLPFQVFNFNMITVT